MIIVPNGYDYAGYQKSFIGTGKFKMTSYTATVGASFARNPHYWGKPALPERTEWTFYAADPAVAAALEAGAIDCLDQFTLATGPQLLNGNFHVIALKASSHRELSMRTDMAPLHEQVCAPGDCLHAGPARDRGGAVQGVRGGRKRQPVRAGVPVHEHDRATAARRT